MSTANKCGAWYYYAVKRKDKLCIGFQATYPVIITLSVKSVINGDAITTRGNSNRASCSSLVLLPKFPIFVSDDMLLTVPEFYIITEHLINASPR
jgi:hypothetical protein